MTKQQQQQNTKTIVVWKDGFFPQKFIYFTRLFILAGNESEIFSNVLDPTASVPSLAEKLREWGYKILETTSSCDVRDAASRKYFVLRDTDLYVLLLCL